MKIKPKKLFNPDVYDNEKKVFGGDTTNTFNLYDIQYKWSWTLFEKMLQNNWIPESSSMLGDKNSYEEALSEDERTAFLKILSFLIYLDSIQTNNIQNISDYITAPEITLCLARQTFDEALHSRSYGYILTNLFDRYTALKAIYYWREDEILLNRNKYIAEIYQEHKHNPTDDTFIRVLVANYLLEGVYFYNGFYFFYNLAARGLMTQTATQIRYIERDELSHTLLFSNIIKEIQRESPELWKRNIPVIKEMFNHAVEEEIKFSKHIIGDKILGMSSESIENYAGYLGNKRLTNIGMEKQFTKAEDPYKHLRAISGVEDDTSVKTNVFESRSINYKKATIFSTNDWDSL